MGFCSCLNKTFLFILNFIVFAVGSAVIALASVVIHRGNQFQALFNEGIVTLPIWVLIVGVVITLLGFFGCCGACQESRCMLLSYGVVVFILLVVEIALGVLLCAYPESAEEQVQIGLKSMFNSYDPVQDPALASTIDVWQHDLKCCGVKGSDDWLDTKYGSVPKSCCKVPEVCPNIAVSYFSEGCYKAVLDDLSGVTIALGIAAIILAIVQVVCIFVSCGLAHRRAQYA